VGEGKDKVSRKKGDGEKEGTSIANHLREERERGEQNWEKRVVPNSANKAVPCASSRNNQYIFTEKRRGYWARRLKEIKRSVGIGDDHQQSASSIVYLDINHALGREEPQGQEALKLSLIRAGERGEKEATDSREGPGV